MGTRLQGTHETAALRHYDRVTVGRAVAQRDQRNETVAEAAIRIGSHWSWGC
jgi:hypothetical protein